MNSLGGFCAFLKAYASFFFELAAIKFTNIKISEQSELTEFTVLCHDNTCLLAV